MLRVTLGILAIAALAVAIVILRPAPTPTPDIPSRFVVNDSAGQPVAGARVSLFLVSPYRMEPRPVAEAVTRKDGGAPLPELELAEGDAEVVVVRPGDGPPVAVPVARIEGTLHLPDGRPTSGRVLDLRGRPVVGARVMTPGHPPYAAVATSDDAGRYDLGVIADDAWIRAEADGRAILDLPLAFYAEEGEIVFLLAPGFTISGRVATEAGDPVSGAIIELEQEGMSRKPVGEDGRFTFTSVLPNWEAIFTARAPGLVGPPVAALCGEENLTVHLLPPASIEAVVIDGATNELVPEFEIFRDGVVRTAPGSFRIDGLLPGTCTLSVAAGSRSGKMEVTVAAGERVRNIRLPVFHPLWGDERDPRSAHHLTILATRAGPGTPVAGALVRLGDEYRGRTDEAGEFGVRLLPGEYRLVLGGALEPHAAREIVVRMPEDREVAATLTPNPVAILTVDAEWEPGERLVFLRAGGEERLVKLPENTLSFPVAEGVDLDLFLQVPGYLGVYRQRFPVPEDRRIIVKPERGTFVTGTCIGEGGVLLPKVVAELTELPPEMRDETLGDGRFRIGPVHPGPYQLQLTGRNIRTWRKSIVVPPEGIDTGTARLLAPCDLHIRVFASDGVPLAGAEVRTTYRVEARGVTDGSGRRLLPGTEPSELLRVRAIGYLDGWEEIRLTDDSYREEIHVELHRPARIIVRAVDGEGRPVHLLEPRDTDLCVLMLRTDQLLLTEVPPGPLVLELEGRAGRKGELRIDVPEGEQQNVTVTLTRP